MKYIRTSDGRIMKHPHPNEEVFTFRYEIVKSANSIKDLLDFIVIEWQDERIPHFMPCNNISLEIGKETNDKNCVVYGAIYIKGKGLIYVAKMNAKGKLELI